uniref:Gag-like protein n=1 Tax=Knipowitschia caucasica TaxID=637954 RepID=A0AAV2M3W4_KNICA
MADSVALVQLKANRSAAKRQFSRQANNVLRMYSVLSEEELKDSFKTMTIEANKVFEANDDVEEQYTTESKEEGGAISVEQRADLDKTKTECETKLDELKDIILKTLWSKYGEEELKIVVEAAESEAECVGAIELSQDEEGYDFLVKHLGTLVGRVKSLHTMWKCWAPAEEQASLQSRVSDLERALLKLTTRKAHFIQARVNHDPVEDPQSSPPSSSNNPETSNAKHEDEQNGAAVVSSSLPPGCVVCGDMKHSQRLYFCKQFQALKLSEKREAVRKLGACVKCLQTHGEQNKCKDEYFCKRAECSESKDHHFLLCPKPPKVKAAAVGGDRRSYTDAQKEFVKKLPPGLAKECRNVFNSSGIKTFYATNNTAATGERFAVVASQDAARGNSQRWVKDWYAQRPSNRYKQYSPRSQPQK